MYVPYSNNEGSPFVMIIDIVIAIVLLISAFIAFLRGFIREVLTIAGVAGGLAAAYSLGPKVAPIVRGWMGVEAGVEPEKMFGIVPYTIVADALAYGAIFILVVIVLSIVSHILAETVKNLGLGAIDRTFGVIFGVVRGAVLLGLLYLPVHMLVDQETKEEWFKGSKSYFYLESVSGYMQGFLPEGAAKEMEEKAGGIEDLNSAKEKLKGINLLGDDKAKDSPKEADKPDEGYDENFREKMDNLIQEQTRTLNE